MFYVNILAAVITFISSILYGFVYTPLKRKGPIAVFVGALPGALPPLIGWVAASGSFSYLALLIFGIQFVWQFPHFWAIAWVLDEEYKEAGFKLLPSGGASADLHAYQWAIQGAEDTALDCRHDPMYRLYGDRDSGDGVNLWA